MSARPRGFCCRIIDLLGQPTPMPGHRCESRCREKSPEPRQDYSTNQPNLTGWPENFANAQLLRSGGPFAKAPDQYCSLPLDTWVGFLVLVRRPRWRRQGGLFAASHFPTGNMPLHSEDPLV